MITTLPTDTFEAWRKLSQKDPIFLRAWLKLVEPDLDPMLVDLYSTFGGWLKQKQIKGDDII